MSFALQFLGALAVHFLITRALYWLARNFPDTPVKTFVVYVVYTPLILGLSWRLAPEQPLWPQSAALCILVLLDFFVWHPYRPAAAAEIRTELAGRLPAAESHPPGPAP